MKSLTNTTFRALSRNHSATTLKHIQSTGQYLHCVNTSFLRMVRSWGGNNLNTPSVRSHVTSVLYTPNLITPSMLWCYLLSLILRHVYWGAIHFGHIDGALPHPEAYWSDSRSLRPHRLVQPHPEADWSESNTLQPWGNSHRVMISRRWLKDELKTEDINPY